MKQHDIFEVDKFFFVSIFFHNIILYTLFQYFFQFIVCFLMDEQVDACLNPMKQVGPGEEQDVVREIIYVLFSFIHNKLLVLNCVLTVLRII